jgi:peptidoglycan/LPS O-acetylase OafA/YrhL
MGTLRTLFAVAVVFAHSYGYVLVGGRNAVQLFYMISGFLISYVIVEKKAYPSIKSFYINRFLRLYPIYVVVAVLTLIAFFFGLDKLPEQVAFFATYQKAPFAANALLATSNISLFFQDWVMFAAVENNQLKFATNFYKSEVVLYKGLIVPQAWTLGIELCFYAIAPFVLAKRKILLTLLTLSLALRIYLVYIGLGMQDPWTYRFFPTELALFLLGALSHQVVLPLYKKVFASGNIEKYSAFATYSLIFITLVFWLIPVSPLKKSAVLFAIFFVAMPLTFLFQSKRDWDKWVGDLSYPIYICHMLVIYVVSFFMERFGIQDTVALSLTSVVFTICISVALNIYVGKPVEALRNKFRVT